MVKKLLTNWQVWAGLAVILAFIIILRDNSISAVLPFAVFLICPLMMVFMMKDHHKH